MNAGVHHVADKEVAAEFFGELYVGVLRDTTKCGGLFGERLHVGAEAHDRYFSKVRIVGAANELIQRRTVTVGGVTVALEVEHETEWIYLSQGELLHTAAVHAETERVA